MKQKNIDNPPYAPKIDKRLEKHGDLRIDPYYWLKEREQPEVRKYLEAENAYLEAQLAPVKDFRETLYVEMKGRIKEDDQSVPYKDNGYFYLTRYEKGYEYPIYARKKETLAAPEEELLNVNTLAQAHDFFQIGGLSISSNNQILAFSEDKIGRRLYTIRFKNLVSGDFLEDEIPLTGGKPVWANDNQSIFYSVKDESLRPYKIFRHQLGTSVDEDVEVFHEADPTFLTFVYKTKTKKYIVIGSHQSICSEYSVLNANEPEGAFQLIQARERGLEYSIAHFDDQFYVLTNLDAQNFRLMVCSEERTSKEYWQEIIPHRDEILLEDIDIFKDFLVLSERIKGITQIRVIPKNDTEHYLDFGEDSFVAYTSINRDFDTKILRVGYQSMTTPPTIFDYDMETRSFQQLKQQEVLGGFNAEDYRSERLYAPARDGQKIPISIVYRKDFEQNGQAPLLLYAYGSYGHSMEPYFSSVRLSLLDRGFSYAIAHVRGGEEMGRHWYEDGKLLKKKHTFYDFIDCGEYLLEKKYTHKTNLFAMGGSAGGLLMGAIINLRPDLWKGVVAAVPFVDVLTTMLDDTIPLTTGEYDEWGNPNDKTFYDYIKSYSPYDNVEEKEYPALLVTTGLHDSQVQYWEPAKWVAKLRDKKTDQNILLLHTNLETGHGGPSGRFERLKEMALDYAFILYLANRI